MQLTSIRHVDIMVDDVCRTRVVVHANRIRINFVEFSVAFDLRTLWYSGCERFSHWATTANGIGVCEHLMAFGTQAAAVEVTVGANNFVISIDYCDWIFESVKCA